MKTRIPALACSLAFLLLAACGGSGGSDGAGGGGCSPESDATLCAAASAECGGIVARDRCGTERALDCGGCEDPLWCGGGGEANRCGATCPVGCPDGWTCELGVCTGGDRTGIVLDLRTVRVGGKVTLGGVAPTVSPDCYDYTAMVTFNETITGASSSSLIPCDARDFAFEAEVAPGTYEVTVSSYRVGDSNLPEGYFVFDPVVIESARSDVLLDLRTVSVAGRLTLNGAAPTVAVDCYDFTANVGFREVTTGTSAWYRISCDDPEFRIAADLPPGVYAVTVSPYRLGDSNLPEGTFVVDPALRVDGPLSGLRFDLRTVDVAGRVTLAGAVPEVDRDCYDYTTVVSFYETSTGASASTRIGCQTSDFSFALAVAPGTYAVSVYKYREDDSNLPSGTLVANPALRVDGPVTGLVLDVSTVAVGGSIRWNGATPTVAQGCYDYTATVTFVETSTGAGASALVPCSSASFSFGLDLAPGTYAVSVSKYRTDDSNLPDGSFLVAPAARIEGPTSGLALDLRTVRVAGTITVDGRTPTVAQDCYDYTTSVTFRSGRLPRSWQEATLPGNLASTTIACGTRDFSWHVEVPLGDYLVGVAPYRLGDSSLPDGTFAAVNRLAVR